MASANATLLDAGMGKALAMLGVEIPATIWSANALIVAPETVLRVHKDNIAAGADIITTNSYGIIRSDLAKEGIEDRFAALNRQAGELARQAVRETGSAVRIAGSLPPLNGSYRPDRVRPPETMRPLYQEQAALLAPYVDYFLCETMSAVAEAETAAAAASTFGKPVLVALTLHDDKPGCLKSGERIEDAAAALAPLEPAGLLANCCLPERIGDAMPALCAAGFDYCGGYANTFTPVPPDWLLDGEKESDRTLALRDDLTPTTYCRFAASWIDAGANLVGGCCGTTAEHTRALRKMLS